MTDNQLEPGQGGEVAPRAPEQSQSPAMDSPPPGPSPMEQHFSSGLDKAQQQYTKMKGAVKLLGNVRKEMDKLVGLADTVTQDDVVEASAKIVAAGVGATAMAGLLAQMPDSGEALQAWVAQFDQGVAQREAQAQRALDLTRHHLGMVAFRGIMAHSAEAGEQQGEASAPESSPPSNPLSLQGTPDNG